jgi:hypothetical protein
MSELGYADHVRVVMQERERVRQLLLAHEPLPCHRDTPYRFECMAEDWKGDDLRMHVSHLLTLLDPEGGR